MTFRAAGTRVPYPPCLALVLVVFAAVAGLSAAQAQTTAPESAVGDHGLQGAANSYLPQPLRDRFDPVRFMNAFASHYYLHPENPAADNL